MPGLRHPLPSSTLSEKKNRVEVLQRALRIRQVLRHRSSHWNETDAREQRAAQGRFRHNEDSSPQGRTTPPPLRCFPGNEDKKFSCGGWDSGLNNSLKEWTQIIPGVKEKYPKMGYSKGGTKVAGNGLFAPIGTLSRPAAAGAGRCGFDPSGTGRKTRQTAELRVEGRVGGAEAGFPRDARFLCRLREGCGGVGAGVGGVDGG